MSSTCFPYGHILRTASITEISMNFSGPLRKMPQTHSHKLPTFLMKFTAVTKSSNEIKLTGYILMLSFNH